VTNDELLAKVDTLEARYTDYPTYLALRAVVELHKDYTTAEGSKFCVICTRTEDEWEYPCPTIKAIEGALND
jgi:hypothetical protein